MQRRFLGVIQRKLYRPRVLKRPGNLAHQSPCKGCRGIPSSPLAGHERTSGIALSEHRHSTE